ncbi:MAG: hypothetical protein KatS3mg014_0760 [Actinomycetota bacterium]|nr:MAG: hypothetical protein KatS3mg014_0760 [Actinomycetota bacterium]
MRTRAVAGAGLALLALLALLGARLGLRDGRRPAVPADGGSPSGPGGLAAPAERFADDVVYALAPEQIPAIDEPRTVSVRATVLPPTEPVLSVEIGGASRAYPIRYLLFHEIVNDELGGVPLAVTYCPLCNTGIVFERPVVHGRTLTFGVSGLLLHSNLVMVDRETGSLWSQALGEAIGGELEGARLELVPAAIVSWSDWSSAHPDGTVLGTPTYAPLGPKTGGQPPYGVTPYRGYDRGGRPPFVRGRIDHRLPAFARVLAIVSEEDPVAIPFAALRERAVRGWSVLPLRVAGEPVVVFWRAGTVSALDAPLLADSRDVGAAGAFSPIVDGRRLRFVATDDGIIDAPTGSRWDVLGRAISGPLRGASLRRVPSFDSFWFDWAAFRPQTRIAGT